ncbi:TPA: response regulator [Streptococcus suis]|nr:response regulator [Streptococcus suis]HEM4072268.1 response regulator [Streptococcus suis]
MKGRILIADNDPMVRRDVRQILEKADFEVVAEASDGFEAIELSQKYRSDLVVMSIQLPLLDGLTACKKIMDDNLAYSVLLLTTQSDEQYVEKAKKYGVSGYLVKPLDAKSLIPMVEVCIARGRQFQHLTNEMAKLTKKINDRIIIEKAKGLLMSRDHLSESAAFKHIRTISMQKRVPMVEIDKLLVMHDEF